MLAGVVYICIILYIYIYNISDLAEFKFPATINMHSYMVCRSLAITQWIFNIHVTFLQSFLDNIACLAALYSSHSGEVVDSIINNID